MNGIGRALAAILHKFGTFVLVGRRTFTQRRARFPRKTK